MLNYIQLALGLLAVGLIFAGLFSSIRKLDKEDKTKTIPTSAVMRSMILIGVGLLCYAGVKTCTYLPTEEAAEYDMTVIFLTSLVEVVKYFGFIILIPLLVKVLKPKLRQKN